MRSEKEAWSKAKPIYQKALSMDQKNLNAYQEIIRFEMLGSAFLYEWEIDEIEKIYTGSTNLKRLHGRGEGFFMDYTRKAGRLNDFLQIANNYMEKYPTQSQSYVHKASSLFFLGRHEEAIELLSKQDEIYDNDYFYLMETAKYYLYMGEQEKSRRQLDLFKSQFADRPPIIIWLDAVHAQMEGKTDLAAKNMSLLEDAYNQKTSGSPAWFIALYYCHIKGYDKAFEWLRKSYNRHEVEMTWLKEEPILRPLKNDPRYLELYEKVGFSKLDL
jgi:tetratricopeptide (TPR) repeat protein